MMKTLFLFEWKKLYRTPLYLILLAFFILIGVYSVHYGNTMVSAQKVVVDSLESAYKQKINASIQKFKSDTLTKQGKADFSSVSEPSSVNYFIKPYAIFSLNGFSALSIGQRDVLPFYKQISTERNFTQSYAPDISNPEVLAEGNIDLSFVIVYLLPLLMVGFTYNILSSEKENGTFPLMAIQVGKPSKTILFKYIVRVSIVFLAVILLNVYAIIHVSGTGAINSLKTLYWIGIVCSYFLFWAAACYFFIVLGKSSTITVFYMSASWLLLVLLLPFSLNLYVDLTYPTVLRADMVSEQRKIEEVVWSIKPKELIWNFYSRHPQYKTGNYNDTFQYSPRRFAAYYDEMERRLYPVAKRYNDRIDERSKLMTAFSDLLPTLTAQKAFSQIAQSDLASFKRFDESSLGFQQEWQAYIYGFIFNDKKFKADDYKRFPAYQYHAKDPTTKSCLLLIFSALLIIITTNYINKKQFKMKKMRKRYFLLIPLISASMSAFAQNPQPTKPITDDTLRKPTVLQEVVIRDIRRKLKNDTLSQTLKLDQPLLTMPQNIISISSAVLVDQGVFSLRDAARNSSSTYFGLNNNVFDGASNLYMRGLPQNRIIRNGLPSGNFGRQQDDEVTIDRIEFIKGPAGFLGSSGEAGGSINVVTKAPTDHSMLNATLTAGSYNFYRAAVDVGGEVKEKGFSYRFNAAYNYQQYSVDIMKSNKLVIAPVVQYNFSKRTSILAEYILNNQNAIGGSTYTKFFTKDKLLTDNRHANYQADPGLPTSTSKSQYGRLVFKHEFNNNWRITSQSAFNRTSSDTWSFLAKETGWNAVGFDENGLSHRLSYRVYNKNRGLSTQLFLNGKFKTGEKITHRLMAGGEYVFDKDSTYQSYCTKSFLLDINNLQYGLNREDLQGNQKTFNGFRYDNNFAAAYLYNTTSFGEKLFVQFGGRYTYNKRENSGIFSPEVKTLKQKAFTPRVGLSYLIDNYTSVYALYDQSFVPTAGQDINGKAFEPIRGEDREIGIKRDWFAGKLSTSITGFDIARNNMVTTDPANPQFNKQVGQVRSKGIEVDVIGRIIPNITVSANYSYAKAKITKDTDPEIVGRLYASAPQQVINTWFRYTFPSNFAPGLSLALGQTSIIKKATTTPGTFIPDYTKLDGSVAYTYWKITARLLLDNLTNKRYIQAGDIYKGNGYYTEGMPFNFKLSVAFRL